MDKLYISVYEKIKNEIIGGIYKSGEKLPSKRVCAERNGVSVVTVEHAYAMLEEEGYISAVTRSGYFCAYNSKEIYSGVKETENIKNFSLLPGIKENFPESVYLKAVRKVITEQKSEILQKSENSGLFILRSALSKYLIRCRGIKADPERIIIGSGAQSLYHMIICLLGKDRIFAIEDPSYKKIENEYKSHGIEYRKLKLENGGINSTELKSTDADILHVTPYRSFPSGITATAAKRAEYLKWANLQNGIIIEDDYGSEFYRFRKPFETLYELSCGNVIYLNTFSKTISSAVKTGYIILPENFYPLYEINKEMISCTVPTLDQLVLAELLNNGSFERNLNRIRRKIRKNEI